MLILCAVISLSLVWSKVILVLKQAHDEGSQSHAVAGELRTLSDFWDQAVKDPGGWACSRVGLSSKRVHQRTNKQSTTNNAAHDSCFELNLPILVESSTTLQEWLRRCPMMRSSLWSRRPSSKIFWTEGHKCSRTRPAIVGLRELLPRRICRR